MVLGVPHNPTARWAAGVVDEAAHLLRVNNIRLFAHDKSLRVDLPWG